MKINRLIDDFDDNDLRNYWDLNLKHIYSKPINESIGINNLFFSAAYRLNLITSDFYKDSTNFSTKKSENFMSQSNTDLYNFYNYQICTILTEHVTQWGNKDSWYKERSSFFDSHLFNKTNEEFEKEYQKHPFSPPLSFFNLKINCKDLLLMPILVESFYLKITNEELIKLSKQIRSEFLLKVDSLK